MLSDIQIAQNAHMLPITQVAAMPSYATMEKIMAALS